MMRHGMMLFDEIENSGESGLTMKRTKPILG